MERFSVPWKLLIFCFIVIVAGGILAASTTGWISPKQYLSRLPLFSERTKVDKNNKKYAVTLEEENKQLKKRIADLETTLENLKRQEAATLTSQGNLQKLNSEQEQKRQEKLRALADYYASMKPNVAVEIMKNLDQQLVIEILQVMDKEQVGEILAAMEPARAAKLMEEMFKSP